MAKRKSLADRWKPEFTAGLKDGSLTQSGIAKKLKVTPQRVQQYCRDHGISGTRGRPSSGMQKLTPSPTLGTDEDLATLRAYCKARKMNASEAIRHAVRNLRQTMRNKGQADQLAEFDALMAKFRARQEKGAATKRKDSTGKKKTKSGSRKKKGGGLTG